MEQPPGAIDAGGHVQELLAHERHPNLFGALGRPRVDWARQIQPVLAGLS